jgi:hypothetical protein
VGRRSSQRGLLELGSLLEQPHLTIIGYLSVLAAGITLRVVAIRSPGRLQSLGRVLWHVVQSRTGRAGVIVTWAWIGLHFFAC